MSAVFEQPSAPADLDDRADRLHSRRDALMLYLDSAFNDLVVGLGYDVGQARWDYRDDDGDVELLALFVDGRQFRAVVGAGVVRDALDRHEVERPTYAQMAALVADAVSGRLPRQEYAPRWIGEKRAASELVDQIRGMRFFPRVEKPKPPTRRQWPDFAEYLRAVKRGET